MGKNQSPAELLDANPLGRIDFFGDLQVQARQVEVFAEPNRTDPPAKQVRTVAAAVKESGALLAQTLGLVEVLFDTLAEERALRRNLEERVAEMTADLQPAGVR
jgi:hypothetical protein